MNLETRMACLLARAHGRRCKTRVQFNNTKV